MIDEVDARPLTDRENHVVRGYGQGLTGRQVAKQLGLSDKTVSEYRRRALTKLNLTTTAALIRHAIKTGLVD